MNDNEINLIINIKTITPKIKDYGNRKNPLIGEPLPQMKVLTTHGPKVIPDDYKGKWLILFSHPGDFTPVCTTEFYAFLRNMMNSKIKC